MSMDLLDLTKSHPPSQHHERPAHSIITKQLQLCTTIKSSILCKPTTPIPHQVFRRILQPTNPFLLHQTDANFFERDGKMADPGLR